MISGQISLGGLAAEKQLRALFDSNLSTHIHADVVRVDSSLVLLVWEGGIAPSPADRVKQHSHATMDTVHHALQDWPLQAVSVALSVNAGGRPVLTVARNHHAFCPLYVLQKGGMVAFHWDPTALYAHLGGSGLLDRTQCAAFLNLCWAYGPDTVFKDIKMIPERAVVVFDEQGHRFVRPPAIVIPEAQSLKQGADPVRELQGMLAEAIQWWGLDGARVFCEQSSGLDTTLISFMVAAVNKGAPQTIGYYPLDDRLDEIRARREEAVRMVGSVDFCPSIESYFESAFSLGEAVRHWPYEAPTFFEKSGAARFIESKGGSIVFSGIGGDELCRLSEKEWDDSTHVFNATQDNARFVCGSVIHDALVKDSVYDMRPWPVGFVPESAHDVANAIAPIYLRRNIWYAHPLALGHIQVFAHFLPTEWRKNRRLSRDVLRRLGMSEHFSGQTMKESLETSFHKLLSDDDIFRRLFKTSILADERLIDMKKLKAARTHLQAKRSAPSVMGNILMAYVLEQSLKTV